MGVRPESVLPVTLPSRHVHLLRRRFGLPSVAGVWAFYLPVRVTSVRPRSSVTRRHRTVPVGGPGPRTVQGD